MTTTLSELPLASLAALPDVHAPLTLTALEPVVHGAGTAGNSLLMRTQDVLLPGGRRTSVPYVSGNSIRHRLRDALAWHLLRTLDVPEGTLGKPAADLLWSGGALASGHVADLGLAREAQQVLPGLGLLGYAARSDLTAGTLAADSAHLVCAENAWRLPARLASHPHAALPAGAMRADDFAVRNDITGTPADRYVALAEGTRESVQMIHDMQVIRPGSVLFAGLHCYCPAAGHLAALAAACDEAMPGLDGRRTMTLGAGRAHGHGTCEVSGLAAIGDLAAMKAAYEDHLRAAGRSAVLGLLDRMTG